MNRVARSTETLRPVAILLAVSALSYACGALTAPPPETVARDAYKAAVTACRVYELAPAEHHNDEADRACRSLRLVCGEAPAEGGASADVGF